MKEPNVLSPASRCAIVTASAILFVLAGDRSASATDVFVNGVRVTGLKDTVFKGCTVEFDVAGALILPSGEMIKTLSNVSRLQECGDVKYDVSKGYNGKGRASIELVYSSRELPGQEFSEGTFIPVSWVDKSSKRLGINDPK